MFISKKELYVRIKLLETRVKELEKKNKAKTATLKKVTKKK